VLADGAHARHGVRIISAIMVSMMRWVGDIGERGREGSGARSRERAGGGRGGRGARHATQANNNDTTTTTRLCSVLSLSLACCALRHLRVECKILQRTGCVGCLGALAIVRRNHLKHLQHQHQHLHQHHQQHQQHQHQHLQHQHQSLMELTKLARWELTDQEVRYFVFGMPRYEFQQRTKEHVSLDKVTNALRLHQPVAVRTTPPPTANATTATNTHTRTYIQGKTGAFYDKLVLPTGSVVYSAHSRGKLAVQRKSLVRLTSGQYATVELLYEAPVQEPAQRQEYTPPKQFFAARRAFFGLLERDSAHVACGEGNAKRRRVMPQHETTPSDDDELTLELCTLPKRFALVTIHPFADKKRHPFVLRYGSAVVTEQKWIAVEAIDRQAAIMMQSVEDQTVVACSPKDMYVRAHEQSVAHDTHARSYSYLSYDRIEFGWRSAATDQQTTIT